MRRTEKHAVVYTHYTYLRVIEESSAVVDTAADTVRQRPLSVDHELIPRLVEAQR